MANIDTFVFAIWPKAVREVVHFQECGGTFQGKTEWSLIQTETGVPKSLRSPKQHQDPVLWALSIISVVVVLWEITATTICTVCGDITVKAKILGLYAVLSIPSSEKGNGSEIKFNLFCCWTPHDRTMAPGPHVGNYRLIGNYSSLPISSFSVPKAHVIILHINRLHVFRS